METRRFEQKITCWICQFKFVTEHKSNFPAIFLLKTPSFLLKFWRNIHPWKVPLSFNSVPRVYKEEVGDNVLLLCKVNNLGESTLQYKFESNRIKLSHSSFEWMSWINQWSDDLLFTSPEGWLSFPLMFICWFSKWWTLVGIGLKIYLRLIRRFISKYWVSSRELGPSLTII